MQKRDNVSVSHQEGAAFRALTDELDEQMDELLIPTDGWDSTPRPFNIDPPTGTDQQAELVKIPTGHIALMGDFESNVDA